MKSKNYFYLILAFCCLTNISSAQQTQSAIPQLSDAHQHTQECAHHAQAPAEKQVFHTNDHSEHQCAFEQRHTDRLQNDPVYQEEMMAREQMIRDIIEADFGGQRSSILTVPVVVHIIHNGEAVGSGTNISDEQIYSAIESLNEDYRKMPGTNGDGIGVDTDIEFCLAVRDPDNNPTNGINRVDGTSVALYGAEGITAGQGSGANEMDVKNLSRWPNQQYYNIWVVSEIEDNDGGAGIQGYAYFPTTSQVDGTVILYNAFGTVGNLKSYTNMNRTTTHELGHGLNLYHTFQGNSCTESNCNTQGDRVCDTPATTLNSNCNSPACDTQQVENYLDYTSQTCKNTFTQGQKDRMRAALMGSRANLLASQACVPVNNLDCGITDIAAPTDQLCSTTFSPVVTITNFGSATLSSVEIEFSVDGNNTQTFNWTGSLATGTSEQVSLPVYTGPAGGGQFIATTNNPNGTSDENMSNDTSTSDYESISGNGITVTIVTDFYGTETTWELVNSDNTVVASGGPYENGAIGTAYVHDICLTDGCYEFEIFDQYGDGMCCSFGAGSYTVEESDGTVIASGSEYGDSEVSSFCVSSAGGASPTANFVVNETEVCTGGSVSFTDLSSDAPAEWSWTFEGGTPSTSTAANPANIVYNTPGNYNVTLTATNVHGFDTEIKTNYITVNADGNWFEDSDGDGFGDPFSSITSCTQPAGYVNNNGDCDDSDASTYDDCYDCAGAMWGSAYIDNCGNCVAGTTGAQPCIQDCNGDWGGTAAIDNCGTCAGGNTGNTACAQDCNGDWGGTATTDNCGNCVGGNTGNTPCVQDCNGDWGGTAAIDNCGVCAGGNTGTAPCAQDCNDDWGGTAFIDDCGTCAGGNTGNTACVTDCAGVPGGSAFLDNCNECVGGNTGNTPCVQDCNGDWGGTAAIDNCGDCAGGNTGTAACTQDCNGDWGGTASTDNCGTCVGGNTGNTPCVQDCNGDWGGSATTDNCGDCVGGNTGNTPCVQDCNGDWGGSATTDNCGDCVGGNTGNSACDQDCNGVWGGTAFIDNCDECVGGNTGNTACATDCAGVPGGSAFLDNCNECVGGNTGNTPCVQDCNGDWGGSATTDNCGDCVGGNTGNTACTQDCNDVWGGTAFIDNCDECVGGNTGNTACATDCAGVPGGSAFLDNCNECVGGNTGNTPCVQDCNGVWGGTAFMDDCGECAGGNTGNDPCDEVTDCENFSLALVSANNPWCHDDQNGSIEVAATGGSSNVSFNWNNGVTSISSTANNLAGGTYTISATDNESGCTSELEVQLMNPEELVIESLEATNPGCPGMSTGTIVANVTGGSGELIYSWNDSENQSGETANNLAAGNYTLTVVDENGCMASLSTTIEDPVSLNIEIQTTVVTCDNLGSASVSVSGGTGNYAVNWSVPGNFNQTSIDELLPGNYNVWVVDQAGCMEVAPFTIETECPLNNGYPGLIGEPDTLDMMAAEPDTGGDIAQPFALSLSTYPNPSNGEFVNVVLEKSSEVEIVDLDLMDLSGKKLVQKSIAVSGSPFETTLHFDHRLPFGIYILRLYAENEVITHKIVVK